MRPPASADPSGPATARPSDRPPSAGARTTSEPRAGPAPAEGGRRAPPRDGPRRATSYGDKIFKGANPGDLPVEQPTKFEFAVNTKTAKTLGIKLPQTLLIQVTKAVE